jgi:hypothetical protein
MQTPTVTEITRETYFAVRRAWHETPARLAGEAGAGAARPGQRRRDEGPRNPSSRARATASPRLWAPSLR